MLVFRFYQTTYYFKNVIFVSVERQLLPAMVVVEDATYRRKPARRMHWNTLHFYCTSDVSTFISGF